MTEQETLDEATMQRVVVTTTETYVEAVDYRLLFADGTMGRVYYESWPIAVLSRDKWRLQGVDCAIVPGEPWPEELKARPDDVPEEPDEREHWTPSGRRVSP